VQQEQRIIRRERREKQEAEEQARLEAKEQARKEAEEQARLEAKEQARKEAEEGAKKGTDKMGKLVGKDADGYWMEGTVAESLDAESLVFEEDSTSSDIDFQLIDANIAANDQPPAPTPSDAPRFTVAITKLVDSFEQLAQ
jgi:hypothetical protein